jgi:hypothetical protein
MTGCTGSQFCSSLWYHFSSHVLHFLGALIQVHVFAFECIIQLVFGVVIFALVSGNDVRLLIYFQRMECSKQISPRLCSFVKPPEPLAETLENVCRGSERSAELAGYDDLQEECSAEEQAQEASEDEPASSLANKAVEVSEPVAVATDEG